MAASAATELKVLINILSSGTALQTLLNQTNQLSKALASLQSQSTGATAAPVALPKKLSEGAKDATDQMSLLNDAIGKVERSIRFLAGGFLALEAVRFVKDLADTAARAQVLDTVLISVGHNAGYTTEQLHAADRAVQSLGITASSSRQALTQFIQAGLDLSKAGLLARAAQNAAVILGTDSSEAFSRLVNAVQTSNTMILRNMGIIVQAETAYSRFALSINKSVTQLTEVERANAFLNATLLQTERIQGTYLAAMGDVGKQLTSLTRLTENLKQSLGNNLLPAYLAIVQELTVFLEKMNLVSDSIYGQGEGAKELAEWVKVLAHDFLALVELAVRFKDALLVILGTIITMRTIIAPLMALLASASFGTLAAGFTPVGAAVIGIGVSLTILAARFESVNAAAGAFFGGLITILYALGATVATVFSPIKFFVDMLDNVLREPFKLSSWTQPWTDWYNFVTGMFDDVADYWDLTKLRFGQIGPPVDQLMVKQKEHEAALTAEARLLDSILEKQREYNSLKGSPKQQDTAKRELDTLVAQRKALTEKRLATSEALNYTQEQIDRESELLEKVKEGLAVYQEARVLEQARKGKQFVYLPGAGEVGQQFFDTLGKFNSLLGVYNTVGGDAKVTTEELVRNFQNLGKETKYADELKALQRAFNDLSKSNISSSALTRAREQLEVARLQVRSTLLAETAATRAERVGRFREDEKARTDALETELAQMKTYHGLLSAIDKQAYERGEMSLDEYYDQRLKTLRTENAKELEIAQKAVESVEREQALTIRRTPLEKQELENKLQEAKNKLDQTALANFVAERKEGLEREDAATSKSEKNRQLRLDILATYGGETEALAVINNKYDTLIAKTQDADERRNLNAQRQLDINKERLSTLDKILERELREVTFVNNAISLQQSTLDADRQRLQARETTRDISPVEAMRERNSQVIRQLEINSESLASKKKELALRQAALDAQTALVISQQAQAGKGPQDQETLDKVAAKVAPLRAQIVALNGEVITLTSTIETGLSSLESYGKEVGKVFSDSLTAAIQQSIVDFRKAGEVWQAMSTNIANSIANIFAQQLTARIVKALGINKLFDSFFNFVGLGGGGGGRAGSPTSPGGLMGFSASHFAGGGTVSGPGTGTSDSVIARVSTGEHIMPADKTAQWMPLLEGIRLGTILPYALGGMVGLQSIAIPSVIPRRYASGGVVVSDGGAASVQTGGGVGNMIVSLHPDAMNMTMREWLEQEAVRQQGRR